MKYWFLFKELQLRIFVLVTLPIFLLSVYFVIAIDFPVNLPLFSSNLSPDDASKINGSISALLYSYIVSFLVYFLTIILPILIRQVKFFPYLKVRFRSYCEDWADMYNILNVSLQFNSPIADQDCFVKLYVNRTPELYLTILKSDEKCIAFNLLEHINRIEQFHNLLSTNRDSVPSELLSQLDILNSQLILVIKGHCLMLEQGCKFQQVSNTLHPYQKYISQQFSQLAKCQEYFVGQKLMREIAEKIPNKTLIQY